MIAQTSPTRSGPPTLDACIARAEHRRTKLERLSDIGMELAEEIRERNVKAPYHPEPKHDPSRGFANVSRAVRLTVVLEGKIDGEILAMSKGEWPAVASSRSGADASGRTRRAALAEPRDLAERGDREPAYERAESESDYEDESYEEFLDMRFDDCLAAIRTEFGAARSAVVRAASSSEQAADGTSALRTHPPGGAAAPRPVDDPPCAPTFPSRPAWPITGPPPT
jgi:hypothetical protein